MRKYCFGSLDDQKWIPQIDFGPGKQLPTSSPFSEFSGGSRGAFGAYATLADSKI